MNFNKLITFNLILLPFFILLFAGLNIHHLEQENLKLVNCMNTLHVFYHTNEDNPPVSSELINTFNSCVTLQHTYEKK